MLLPGLFKLGNLLAAGVVLSISYHHLLDGILKEFYRVIEYGLLVVQPHYLANDLATEVGSFARTQMQLPYFYVVGV